MKEKRLKTKLSQRAETADPNEPHSVTDNIPHTVSCGTALRDT